MTVLPCFNSADLALMPEDGKRYEVLDGDLHVTHQPNWHHQFAANRRFFYYPPEQAQPLQHPLGLL